MKDARRPVARKSMTLIGASLATLMLSGISGCFHDESSNPVSAPAPAPDPAPDPAPQTLPSAPVTEVSGPPPFVFNDRCVPYEIDHAFMRANGVDPDMILTTFGGDVPPDDGTGNSGSNAPWTWDLDVDGEPVPCDEFHTHKRRTRYEGCHFYDGTPCYFTTNGQLDQDAFTPDAAGRRAFELAEHFVFYEVVQSLVPSPDGYTPAPIFSDPFAGGFAVGTQIKIMNAAGMYFVDDPLGLWKIGFLQFTDKAFNCLADGMLEDCQFLIAMRTLNGSNSQMIGMPLIFTGDEIFELTARGLVTLRYRLGSDGVPGGSEGPRYILCPVHEAPANGTTAEGQDIIQPFPTHLEFQPPSALGIFPDGPRGHVRVSFAFPFGTTPPPAEDNIYANFDCLQRSGMGCP